MPIAAPSAGDRILNTDLGAFYNLLKGVAGSGEAITLVYNAAGVIAFIPSSDPAASTQLFQIKNAASTVKSALTAGGGAVFSSVINTAKSSDIASSGTTDLSTATGNYAQISGTTTITAFGTVQAGTVMVLEFQGALTLTHNATSLILRAGANATTAAGDIYLFVSEGSGNWREIGHLLAASSSDLSPDQLTNYHQFWYNPLGAAGGVAPGVITNVGTGTTVLSGRGHGVQLNTGATNPSSTSVRTHVTDTALTETAFVAKIRRMAFAIGLNTFTNDNAFIYLTSEDVDTIPTATPRHLGVKYLNGTVSFTTGDGTTEQTTAITAFVTVSQVNYFVITFDGTTAKCYIDGALRATHATNVPTGGSGAIVFRAFINNNATTTNASLNLMQAEALIANS